jgi:ATP-dependent DNA helicase RecQ
MLKVWNPSPTPTWVTCIPSLRHPNLVPGFARGLAGRLGIPFIPCITKVKDNNEQKRMQNSYQQVRNLVDVFSVNSAGMPKGPVLLIDDMVDSRWTMTVVASKLRHAGCPAVFPLALALNSQGND